MGRPEDRERKDLLADLLEIVDAGASAKVPVDPWVAGLIGATHIDFTLELHPAQGAGEVDLFEFYVGALPATARSSATFSAASAQLRAGYDYRAAGRYAPYGSRPGKLASPAVEHAQAAARLLNLQPPAPKSFEIVVRRHQLARGTRQRRV